MSILRGCRVSLVSIHWIRRMAREEWRRPKAPGARAHGYRANSGLRMIVLDTPRIREAIWIVSTGVPGRPAIMREATEYGRRARPAFSRAARSRRLSSQSACTSVRILPVADVPVLHESFLGQRFCWGAGRLEREPWSSAAVDDVNVPSSRGRTFLPSF